MNCEHCGGEMVLHRQSYAEPGEIRWFRCRRCDSGQMTSVPGDIELARPSPDPESREVGTPGRILKALSRLVHRR